MATRSFCLAVVFSLLFSTGGMGQSNTRINVQLKWWHQFQFAGYYAAIRQGYYTNAGLNVTLIPGDAKHAAVEEVLSGNANFGVTGSDLLIEYAKGKPLMALALFSSIRLMLLSLRSKGIGLYLVHSQVTSLGGSIEAYSQVGMGTTFVIRF